MHYERLTPCAECPFLKKSLKGWLGPDTDGAETLLNQILGRVELEPGVFIGCEPSDFACHTDVSAILEAIADETGQKPDRLPPEIQPQHCIGALLMLKADHKLPHDRIKVAAMDAASGQELVFESRAAFLKHHGSKHTALSPAPARTAGRKRQDRRRASN